MSRDILQLRHTRRACCYVVCSFFINRDATIGEKVLKNTSRNNNNGWLCTCVRNSFALEWTDRVRWATATALPSCLQPSCVRNHFYFIFSKPKEKKQFFSFFFSVVKFPYCSLHTRGVLALIETYVLQALLSGNWKLRKKRGEKQRHTRQCWGGKNKWPTAKRSLSHIFWKVIHVVFGCTFPSHPIGNEQYLTTHFQGK